MERLALASGQAREPMQTTVSADHTVARIDVPLIGSGEDTTSMAALSTLRTRDPAGEPRKAPRRPPTR